MNGNIDKAIEYYKLCLEIDPNFHTAYFNMGLGYNSEDDI